MGNVHMEATQINYREGGTKMSVAQAIKNAGSEITPEEKTWIDSIPALTTSNAGKTDQDVIAPEFDAESGVYAVGDKVMYEGKLYEFTTAHETPGDWDSSEVSETTVADELNSLESGLTNKSIVCDILVSAINTTAGNWNLDIALNTDKKLSDYDLFVFNRYKSGSTYPVGVSYLVTKGQLTSSSGGYPIKLIDGSGNEDSFYVGRVDDTHIGAYKGTSIDTNTVFCLYGIKLSQ